MVILVLILALIVFLVIGLLAFFVAVVVGIRNDERHMNLTRAPRTRASALGRRLLAGGTHRSEHDEMCMTDGGR
jgi:hypothetical protein